MKNKREDATNPDIAEIRNALQSEFRPLFPELQERADADTAGAKPVRALRMARACMEANGLGADKVPRVFAIIDDALQERADTGKDAERYQWLRNEHFPTADKPPVAQVTWKRGSVRHSSEWANLIDGNDLDNAIDAAILAANKGAT
jgi:hypothetical protein